MKTAGAYQNLTLISDGLKAGERVIVNGQLRVAPNAKVMVQGTLPAELRRRPAVLPEAGCEVSPSSSSTGPS